MCNPKPVTDILESRAQGRPASDKRHGESSEGRQAPSLRRLRRQIATLQEGRIEATWREGEISMEPRC